MKRDLGEENGNTLLARAGAGVATPNSGQPANLRASDLKLLAKLPVITLLAWALPEPGWDRIAQLAAVTSRRKAVRTISHVEGFTRGADLGQTNAALAVGHDRNIRIAQAQYLRCYHPLGWRPNIRIEGREHLDHALAIGHGAILWVAPFVFAPLVTKMALHAARYGAVHLSRHVHGGSATRFGVRVINPVRVRVENRFLAERIVIGEDGPAEALRALTQRLAANQIVSITVGAMGVKTHSAPFFASELRIATGAPNLALRTGASLLPAFTVRQAPGQFLTTIESPLQMGHGSRRERATQDVVAGLVALIEAHARGWPDQFHWHDDVTGWRRHRLAGKR